MKSCMVLQRRFALLGHDLAVLLKERGVDEFCSYVILRDSYDFLASQSEIHYTGLILDEDIQKQYKSETIDSSLLERIERDYGDPDLFIAVDRVISRGQHIREYPHHRSPYTKEEALRMVQVYVKNIEDFLEKEKPDFVFIYQPGAMGMLIFYAIAKKRGIPVEVVIFPVTLNLVSLSEEYTRLTWVDDMFRENLIKNTTEIGSYEKAKRFVEEFRNKPVIYSEVYGELVKHGRKRQFQFLIPARFSGTLRSIYFMWRNWIVDGDLRTDFTTINPFWYLVDRIRRKVRNLVGADDLYDAYDPDNKFIFFPLHYEPELATLLLAPHDNDQIAIIQRLSDALPADMFIYVKEHPQMTPFRPRSYYMKLRKIPKVRLLRPELSSFPIIQKSELVATISGAAGWEATIFGKPVVTFGEVFYNVISSVMHVSPHDDLRHLLVLHMKKKINRDEVIRFVAALFEDSATCDLLQLWTFENDIKRRRQELESFADLIVRKAKLLKK